MSQALAERKSVRNLKGELKDLRAAYEGIMKRRDDRGFNHVAGYHGAPDWYCIHSRRHKVTTRNTRLFLPWHRAYLKDLELRLRAIMPNVALPWWDWTSQRSHVEGLPKAFSDQEADGKPNPLYRGYINLPNIPRPITRFTRRTPKPPDELPTKDEVDDVLALSSYGEFCDSLEDIHDRIHLWVRGDMMRVATAAFDPIFWSHHCMVDRVWWIWQQENENANMPEDFKKIVLRPFEETVAGVLNIYDLGYEYVAESKTVSGPV